MMVSLRTPQEKRQHSTDHMALDPRIRGEERRSRRFRAIGRRRRGERGLTLIELLLGLALLALLAAFVAGGLAFARRAFMLDRTADLSEEADAAIETVSDLLESAVPVAIEASTGPRVVLFDGDRDGVSFIGLGTGHALRGGLHAIKIHVDDGRLVADVTPTQGGGARSRPGERQRRVVLLAGVKQADFGFFGRIDDKAAPAWRNDWAKAPTLPREVSFTIAFDDERRAPPAMAISLMQR